MLSLQMDTPVSSSRNSVSKLVFTQAQPVGVSGTQ